MSDRIEADTIFYSKMISDRKRTANVSLYQLKKTSGSGNLKCYPVMSGIEIIYSEVSIKVPLEATIRVGRPCIEVTYCFDGNVEVEFKNRKISYIQPGDISLFNCQTDIKYCDFTEKPFVGFSIILYPKEAIQSINQFLNTDEFKEKEFMKNVWKTESCSIYHPNCGVEHLCKEIMNLPDSFQEHYLKLKVTELLLFLIAEQPEFRNESQYFSKTVVDRVKNIRRFLLDNTECQISIEELAKIEKINKSTMQKCFKEIYGSTIAQYRRRVRMQKAKELLIGTKIPITEIAGVCGYSNISKFSAAYNKEYGETPLQYRNQCDL